MLPACSSLERSEVRAYPQKYVVATRPVIEPLGEARSDTDVVFDLAHRLRLDDPLLDPWGADDPAPSAADRAAAFDGLMDWVLEPSGLTMAGLLAHPGGMRVPDPLVPAERGYETRGFPTPTGKMELASSVLARHTAVTGIDALPVYRAPQHEATPGLVADYPLVLNTGSRLPMFIHSRTYRLGWTRGLHPDPAADLNPVDARRAGVEQGDWIDLTTPVGSVRVRANLTELVLPGVVHLYHDCPEADANLLLDAEHLDPVSGFPAYKGARCRVTKRRRREGAAVSQGFSLDVERCSGCYACVVACYDQNDLDPPDGTGAWRQVFAVEDGTYPEARLSHVSLACQHCAEAPCMAVCPSGALRRAHEPDAVVVETPCASAAACARWRVPSGCRGTAPTGACTSATCVRRAWRPASSRPACAPVPRARCATARTASSAGRPGSAPRAGSPGSGRPADAGRPGRGRGSAWRAGPRQRAGDGGSAAAPPARHTSLEPST